VIFCTNFLIIRVVKFKVKNIKRSITWNGGNTYQHLFSLGNNVAPHEFNLLLRMDANQRKDSQGLNSQPYATATCRHAWWMRPYTQTFTPAATYVLARNKRLYPRRPCMLKCTFVNSMGASWKTDYQSNCRVLVDPSSPMLIERTTMKHRSSIDVD